MDRALTASHPPPESNVWQYTPELGAAIAELYVDADAGGLWGLCAFAPDRIPPPTVIHAWKRQHPAFGLMMREAEKVRAEKLIEQTIVIADTAPGAPARLALQIASRQHLAGNLDRARFGKGASDGPAVPALSHDPQPVALDCDDATLAAIALSGRDAPNV